MKLKMKKISKDAIIPKIVIQHIEEEFRKSPEFRKAYSKEILRLQIGYKITQLRKMRHMSQGQLAKRLHTTQQTISRLESPKNGSFSVNTLIRIADVLKARVIVDFIPMKLIA